MCVYRDISKMKSSHRLFYPFLSFYMFYIRLHSRIPFLTHISPVLLLYLKFLLKPARSSIRNCLENDNVSFTKTSTFVYIKSSLPRIYSFHTYAFEYICAVKILVLTFIIVISD